MSLLGARVPQALQRVTHLAAGNAQADVAGRDAFHLVRFIEDDEIIFEQDAALDFLLDAAEHA